MMQASATDQGDAEMRTGWRELGARERRRMWPTNALDKDREDSGPIPASSTQLKCIMSFVGNVLK